MQEPKLRNCPFCGGPAMLRAFGCHIDPYTGAHTPDIRVGCSAAFTAHGDWGDDHKRCPVAPMIESLMYPELDIVAAWNKRAFDVPAIINAGTIMESRLNGLIETFSAFHEDGVLDRVCAAANIRAIKSAIAAWKKCLANDQQMRIQLDTSAKRTCAAGRQAKRKVKEAPHDTH